MLIFAMVCVQALVTDAPIRNVGELEQRLHAKQEAYAAEARAKRQKLYGRERPLGQYGAVAAAPEPDQPPAQDPPPAHTEEPPLTNPPLQTSAPQHAGPLKCPTSQPSADGERPLADQPPVASPGQHPTEERPAARGDPSSTVEEQPPAADLQSAAASDQPPMIGDQPLVRDQLLAAGSPEAGPVQPSPAAAKPPTVASGQPSLV